MCMTELMQHMADTGLNIHSRCKVSTCVQFHIKPNKVLLFSPLSAKGLLNEWIKLSEYYFAEEEKNKSQQ